MQAPYTVFFYNCEDEDPFHEEPCATEAEYNKIRDLVMKILVFEESHTEELLEGGEFTAYTL